MTDPDAPQGPARDATVDERPGHARIKGRWWRISDPAIPDALRQELVNALMAARRAVGQARRADDPIAERAARDRVQAAKVALGERGPIWWEPMSEADWRSRLRACLETLLAHRAPESSVCPSEIARAVGGEGWRERMPAVRALAEAGRADRTFAIRQRGVERDGPVRGPIRIARGEAFAVSPAADYRRSGRAR